MLIILDLDQTLIHDDINNIKQLGQYDAIVTKHEIGLYSRPFMVHFLDYLFENYDVAIWTAATENWLMASLNTVLRKYKYKFLFRWDVRQVNLTGKMPNISYQKNLEKVWKVFPSYNASNTLLIDDTSFVSGDIGKNNHLVITKFDCENVNSKYDLHLLHIKDLLKKHGNNVKTIVNKYNTMFPIKK